MQERQTLTMLTAEAIAELDELSETPASALDLIDCYAYLWIHRRSDSCGTRAAQLACDYRLACDVGAA